jgi:hypothetical protein
MQTLYRIAVNNVGQYSVDVFNDRREHAYKWRTFWQVSPASILRLRRLYLKYPKRFYVTHEWSSGRWRMYRDWYRDAVKPRAYLGLQRSLVNLETISGDLQP